ncbi:MAG: Fis family transcriptional regulator [Deltaproteobacteria bacterium]|nr:MAG: Fis family transcriptional regulator [Deltaproteobacteria bacterium]
MKKGRTQDKKDSGYFIGNIPPSCNIISGRPSPCCIILESINDGVFTVDLKKRIATFNHAAELLTGFDSTEAIGQHCFDIFRANICEKDCAMDKTIDSGKPYKNPHAFIITKSGDKKPINIRTSAIKDIHDYVIGAIEVFRDMSDIDELRRQLTHNYTPEDIIGRHPRMQEILSLLPDIAESESPVLIEGPTGSGKELIARAVHNLSARKDRPFIPVNCAALPDTLLESELFGYTRGAFTGATRNKPGRFFLAHKGTLFLDEISNTSMAFQADLLRVLEDGEFTPLGETRAIKADFRLVSATNLDLKGLILEEKFRLDLYFRVKVAKITLPPLRERKEDIPLLINHFINKFNLIKQKSIQAVTPEVLSFLMEYPFPGNIRELENIIEYAFITCNAPVIGMEHLSKDLFEDLNDKTRFSSTISASYENEEARKIRASLDKHPGNKLEAARSLGMSRSTLWRKIKKYGLPV